MKSTTSKKGTLRQLALNATVAAAVLGLAQTVGAFGSEPAGDLMCAFSQQLQQSVSVRMEYLVKIDQVRGSNYLASNEVQDMYDNVIPASYQDDDDAGGLGAISIIFGSAKTTARSSGGELDSFTIDCLSCHDGVAASNIVVDYRDRPYNHPSRVTSKRSDHPVGMTYAAYVAGGPGYKDVGDSTRMIFVNGKVGCLTCHDPLNPEKGHLVMSDRNSALCLTCHDK